MLDAVLAEEQHGDDENEAADDARHQDDERDVRRQLPVLLPRHLVAKRVRHVVRHVFSRRINRKRNVCVASAQCEVIFISLCSGCGV